MQQVTTRSTCRANKSTAVPRLKSSRRRRFRGVAMVRAALTSLVTAACLLSLTGCNGDSPQKPSPSPTASTSPTTTSSSPTEPAVPRYLADYTDEERAAYAAAVNDYEKFSDRNADFYRVGKATPAARAYYKRATAAWQSYWARLMSFESRGIRVVGRGKVTRIRPSVIKLGEGGGGQVNLRVCSVASGVRVFQNDEPVPQPSPKPTITRVSMVSLPGQASWRILFDRVGGPC